MKLSGDESAHYLAGLPVSTMTKVRIAFQTKERCVNNCKMYWYNKLSNDEQSSTQMGCQLATTETRESWEFFYKS